MPRCLAADASHELRTPLAGLRARLEEARLYPGETSVPELLDHAIKDVDRLQQIITDLLMLVQTEEGLASRQPVDLAALVRAELPQWSDRIEMRVRLEPGVLINAVPSLLVRVFTSLLSNAQRHAIHTIEVSVSREGAHAVLSVADDGTGIAVAERQRIFDLFSRIDTARDRHSGGTGLGLAVARNIAIAHHGTLEVEDAPGAVPASCCAFPSPISPSGKGRPTAATSHA
ncbi:HAMP domain-containing histidine kinase [Nonomuraea sp. K274]|uniref:histidine kinase n=1 Tax=Nonomuraea cypriaca TaxID=1187855 RepID=A0A931AF76_9ACTN|nr:HAMP domain-containing sensor histidine kinase [Nonomuraea cypriaca]MBF8191832.1 HAMP domain-containing histidine kinase [Nonomuraea cypriaca]